MTHAWADCTRPTKCPDHRAEYRRRWLADRPGYMREHSRSELPCEVAGCPRPRYVSPGGWGKPRCRQHEADRRRAQYGARPRPPRWAAHAESQGLSVDAYRALSDAQDGRCACCGRAQSIRGRWWLHEGALICHRCSQLVPIVAKVLADHRHVVEYLS